MFDISGPDFLVLIVAALFILGPERIPQAARWLGSTVRKTREYVTGARDQMEAELGSDFGELRKPLQDLAKLRGLDRGAIARQLLDATGGYDPREDLRTLTSTGVASTGPVAAVASTPAGTTADFGQATLAAGERPPFDPDAT
jgi:sec-independent protein translocase protein TatB